MCVDRLRLLTGIAALFLATGTTHAGSDYQSCYRGLRSGGITKTDARRVCLDPGVKPGEYGWVCGDDKKPVRIKAQENGEKPMRYQRNVVCE
jgi:hypothetical protein